MNPQNELFDAIENYLNGGMSEHERFAFEERIAQDKALADQVAEVRASNEAIYYASLAELKNTIGQDIKNIKYKPPIDWKKAGIISVVSLAILSGATTYFVSTENSTIEESKSESKQNSKTQENVLIEENKNNGSKEKPSTELSSAQLSNTKVESTETAHISNTNKEEAIKTDSSKKSIFNIDKDNTPETKTQSNQSGTTAKNVDTPVLNENNINCDKSFKINTEPSCKEKETGSISIISDGAYTYTYQIDIQSKTGSKGLFSHLSAGVYDLLVTYDKECTYKKKVIVEEKWCAMNESYSFNPDYNEKWKPIYESGTSGTILIYDKQGKEIYSLPFGSGNEEWIGNNRQGQPVAVGIYVAFITYSDGRKEKVELTIVR
ncbi:hypothetical protein [Cytophaga aurantiaca]|uniref:hypothetical protein n=1 Tax=Cytophaga aurantiaca TaxID=29530 RepID=UPI00037D4EE6|nr:hypothetical protein [Cytophaga aurantiaca]